jgi:hypothetical protein
LRATLQRRAGGLVPRCRPAFPDKLTKCRQEQSPLIRCCLLRCRSNFWHPHRSGGAFATLVIPSETLAQQG